MRIVWRLMADRALSRAISMSSLYESSCETSHSGHGANWEACSREATL